MLVSCLTVILVLIIFMLMKACFLFSFHCRFITANARALYAGMLWIQLSLFAPLLYVLLVESLAR